MKKILCSTGTIFPRTTPEKYASLEAMADKLTCDGFEFMVDSTMYENVPKLIQIIRPLGLCIPVVHCQKSLGESLCGMKAWFDESGYHEYIMTAEEDAAAFENGIERFKVNLEIANALGAGQIDFTGFFNNLSTYNYAGDFTVEATLFNRATGEVDFDMLNECFRKLRVLTV